MKRYLILVLATLAFAIAAPSAFATRIIFDPPLTMSLLGAPSPSTNCTLGTPPTDNYTPCNVSQRDAAYSVAFVDCSTLSGLKPAADGWCLYLTNVTGGSLSKFTFQFTAPKGGSLDKSDLLQCGSQPPGFATNNCQNGVTVAAGDPLDLTFFAPLHLNKNFYLITDFNNQPNPAKVTVSVPEPGELGLFGLGLLAIGVGCVWRRRRQMSRSDEST